MLMHVPVYHIYINITLDIRSSVILYYYYFTKKAAKKKTARITYIIYI